MAIVRKPAKGETAAAPVEKPAAVEAKAPLAQEEAASSLVSPVEVLDAAKAQIEDVQELARSFALNGLDSLRAAYDRTRVSAEEAVGSVEQVYGKFNDGLRKIQVKAIDNVEANTRAVFDLAREMAAVATAADALSAGGEMVRKQAEALTAQAKEYSELVRSVMEDAFAPFGEAMTKNFGANFSLRA